MTTATKVREWHEMTSAELAQEERRLIADPPNLRDFPKGRDVDREAYEAAMASHAARIQEVHALREAAVRAPAIPKSPPAAKGKEPWEMTQAEWVDGHVKSPAMHREHVRLAVKAGKKVPPEVLRQYGASLFVRDPAPAIPKAAPGAPESGLQADMMGKTTLVQPKGKGKAVTAGMDDYQKLQAMKEEAKPKGKPKAAAKPKAKAKLPTLPPAPTGTISHEDMQILLAGMELKAEAIEERVDRGKAELEAIKEGQDPRLAKLTAIIPRTKEGAAELTHITKGQYRKVWGRAPKPQILTKDGKRVRWEYALDEIAQELHLEDKARREGVNPDEYVKRLIEGALDTKHMITAMESEIDSDERTLKAIDRLKTGMKTREATVTRGPVTRTIAKVEPKARDKSMRVAKQMAKDEALKLVERIQSQRTPAAIAMDNSILSQRVVPLSQAHVWAKAPNRFDIRGVDTPGRGKIVAGVGYANKGAKRLSRKRKNGRKAARVSPAASVSAGSRR